MAPKRIQRKRTKGWKMPEGTVYVGRPSRFGNPYPVSLLDLELCLKLFADTARGIWDPSNVKDLTDETVHWIYELHCDWRENFTRHPQEVIQTVLRGKDLSCWCPLDKPCHADILLEIANAD